MSYQNRRRRASFRGIEFYVKATGFSFGRNVATYEYTTGAIATALDRGAKIRAISVTAFTIGDNYDIERNDLILKLEFEGPGTAYLAPIRAIYCTGRVL